MDDSQDPIRIKITAAIKVFFRCRFIKLSESTLDYMIGAILVHFDDSSEDIQDAVFGSLKQAAAVDTKLVLKHARESHKRMRHKERCAELIEHCQELLEDMDD